MAKRNSVNSNTLARSSSKHCIQRNDLETEGLKNICFSLITRSLGYQKKGKKGTGSERTKTPIKVPTPSRRSKEGSKKVQNPSEGPSLFVLTAGSGPFRFCSHTNRTRDSGESSQNLHSDDAVQRPRIEGIEATERIRKNRRTEELASSGHESVFATVQHFVKGPWSKKDPTGGSGARRDLPMVDGRGKKKGVGTLSKCASNNQHP